MQLKQLVFMRVLHPDQIGIWSVFFFLVRGGPRDSADKPLEQGVTDNQLNPPIT